MHVVLRALDGANRTDSARTYGAVTRNTALLLVLFATTLTTRIHAPACQCAKTCGAERRATGADGRAVQSSNWACLFGNLWAHKSDWGHVPGGASNTQASSQISRASCRAGEAVGGAGHGSELERAGHCQGRQQGRGGSKPGAWLQCGGRPELRGNVAHRRRPAGDEASQPRNENRPRQVCVRASVCLPACLRDGLQATQWRCHLVPRPRHSAS